MNNAEPGLNLELNSGAARGASAAGKSAASQTVTWREEKTARYALRVDNALSDDAVRAFVQNPDALFEIATDVFKHDVTSTVVACEFSGIPCVAKRYNTRNALHILKRCLRQTRAKNSWHFAHKLNALGLKTPNPLLSLDQRFIWLNGRSFFLNHHQPGDLCIDLLPKLDDKRRLENIALRIVMAIKLLTDHGISHGDMKATNILIHNDEPWFLDLDATRQYDNALLAKRGVKRNKKRFLKNWREHADIYDLFARLYAAEGIA